MNKRQYKKLVKVMHTIKPCPDNYDGCDFINTEYEEAMKIKRGEK